MKKLSLVLAVMLLASAVWSLAAGAAEYTLGVGDVLRITVWGHADLATEVAIRPDGYLTFPLVGDLWAVDKTPRQISSELQNMLAEFIVNPQVTVIVSQFRTLHVQVLGEVKESGYYQLKAGARLADVLALAGGPTATADLSSVTVTRYVLDEGGQEHSRVLQVDVNQFLQGGDLAANPLLESGDMIYVPPAGRAAIFGEVRQPASYSLGQGLDILELLAAAGGALDTADLERVVVTSQGEEGPLERIVNVQELLSGRGRPTALRPNDVVFVPKKQQVMVLGAVQNPGVYPLHSEATLLEIIARAGGVLPTGDPSAIAITRRGAGQELIVADLQPALSGRTGGDNPTVDPDDVIFVPEGYQNALVLGAVRSPGSFAVREQWRILDLLAEAGGTTERAGDELTLLRSGVTRTIDLGALERLGLQNERVLPGDVLYVAEGSRQVLVLGEVARPGAYEFRRGDRLLDALALAGGLTPEAWEEQVSLTRQTAQGTQVFTVDFSELMTTRFLADNLPLESGDVIIVPRAARGVIVMGEVQNPGYYQFKAGDSVLDAVMLAGGLLESADAQRVSLTRQTAQGAQVFTVDFAQLMENRVLTDNLSLESGDVIIVPRATRGVVVMGEVQRPGYYQFKAGDSVLDAIMLAGGLLESADAQWISLTRQTAEGAYVEYIDFLELQEERFAAEQRILEDGDVIVVPRSSRNALVLGEVRNPGYYAFGPGETYLDLIGRAGGFTAEADPAKVVVALEGPEGAVTEVVNLDVLSGADYKRQLRGGEVISVPKANNKVLVFGDVVRAGAYTLPSQGRLLDVLAEAGGLKSNIGTEQVVVTRQAPHGEQVWQVTYGQLMGAQNQYNLELSGGDVIYVPAARRQILVLGMVKNPGAYDLPAGARLLDAIALAGGPLDRAALENVGIYRDGVLDESEQVPMGQDKVLFTGDAQENPLLRPGDIIYIPETKKPDWTKIFGFVGAISSFKSALFNIFDW
ncbi:MAG: SLBB domain-containing protein [Limnochordia bacterium]|nr:SLBB domain-containing protein [Limnochordia bacterium]